MTELALLNTIAGGRTSFTRRSHPDLDDLDRMLANFEASGFIIKAMRTTAYGQHGPEIAQVDILGELTMAGESHRARLSGYAN